MTESKEIKNFTDLIAWQESHKLVISIYALTKKFPKDETFSLTSQIRRSAISITSNIAEGFGRRTFKDKAHFYYQSRGSISELRNQLLLSRDISYITKDEYNNVDSLADNAHKILQGLINKTNSFSNR